MPIFVGVLEHEHENCSILCPTACVRVKKPKTKSTLTSDVFPVTHPKLIINDTELATDMQLGQRCCHLHLLCHQSIYFSALARGSLYRCTQFIKKKKKKD